MQKILSIFLILIMTTLPMLSVSASSDSCQNPAPQSSASMQQVMDMEQGNTHECCTGPSVSCDHGNLCDCDIGQAAYSILSSFQSTFVGYQKSTHKDVIPDLFISKNSESLYRPPITIL